MSKPANATEALQAEVNAPDARLSAPVPRPDEVATVIVRLRHWKHTVPTTRERAEMIEDMRAAIDLLESAALSYEQGHRDGYQAGYAQGMKDRGNPN